MDKVKPLTAENLMKPNCLSLLLCLALVAGCATTPSLRVWRPWTRVTTTHTASLNPTNNVTIQVNGSTLPLLGSETLVSDQLREKFATLLQRRGYRIVNSDGDLNVMFTYHTKEEFNTSMRILNLSTTNVSNSSRATAQRLTSPLGAGVSIASAVASHSAQTSTLSSVSFDSEKSYCHTLSIEIIDRSDVPIWKGESTWTTDDLELQNSMSTAIQMLLSALPKEEDCLPIVSKLQKDKTANFFRLECHGYWFTRPALPYRIYFASIPSSSSSILPYAVRYPEYLPAYIDLIRTAEFALPIGRNNYGNPLDSYLWSQVLLGGKYLIKNSNEQVNVMIQLRGESTGYTVQKCWVAKDEEFNDFLSKLREWKQALEGFFDFYEK